jgi:hypothetical protein
MRPEMTNVGEAAMSLLLLVVEGMPAGVEHGSHTRWRW